MINTLVERGPITFLKLVESLEGEIDGVITATEIDGRYYASAGNTLNLTRIEELYSGKYRLSPRKIFCYA